MYSRDKGAYLSQLVLNSQTSKKKIKKAKEQPTMLALVWQDLRSRIAQG